MALLDVVVPQMGEGLQEVVIVGFHKKPGDAVKRDELLYSMETDKAVMDVESPYDGVVKEWLAAEGAVLPIGSPIARIEGEERGARNEERGASNEQRATRNEEQGARNEPPAPSTQHPAPSSQPLAPSTAPLTTLVIPPRTRALCKEHGISEAEMQSIPAARSKLMPSDVEAYLANRQDNNVETSVETEQLTLAVEGSPRVSEGDQPVSPSSPSADTAGPLPYAEKPLSAQQRLFTSRIRRSASLVIPATMTRPVLWAPVSECTGQQREQDFTFRPTEFQTFAWCVARASREHPKLRSTLQGDDTIREYEHLNLGVAVGQKSGDLVTAVVRAADTLEYHDFVHALQAAIAQAREGKDQADASTQLHLTYMGQFGIVDGTPLLVAPAIAILFVGASYPREGAPWVNLSLTIDHRLINGVEGALFLKSIIETVAKLDEIC